MRGKRCSLPSPDGVPPCGVAQRVSWGLRAQPKGGRCSDPELVFFWGVAGSWFSLNADAWRCSAGWCWARTGQGLAWEVSLTAYATATISGWLSPSSGRVQLAQSSPRSFKEQDRKSKSYRAWRGGGGELSPPQGASATCSAPGVAVFALPNLTPLAWCYCLGHFNRIRVARAPSERGHSQRSRRGGRTSGARCGRRCCRSRRPSAGTLPSPG